MPLPTAVIVPIIYFMQENKSPSTESHRGLQTNNNSQHHANQPNIEHPSPHRMNHTFSLKQISPTQMLCPSIPSQPTLPSPTINLSLQEIDEPSQGSSSSVSFYQNLGLGELLKQQKDSFRRRGQIEQLQQTIKQILKTNSGYRQELLEAYKGKTSAKMQTAALKKRLDGFSLQRNVWQLQKERLQAVLESKRQQQIIKKEGYDKMMDDLKDQIQSLRSELEFQKRRNASLQHYNKELFEKLTSKGSPHPSTHLEKARELQLLQQISALRESNSSLSELARRYQKQHELITQSHSFLQNHLQSLQKDLSETRSKFQSSANDTQKIKTDYQSYNKQQLQKLQSKNIVIFQKEKEISYLKQQLQRQKNTSDKILADHNSLRHSFNLMQQQLNILKAESLKRQRTFSFQRQFQSADAIHSIAELNNQLAHERLMRQHLGEELKKQQRLKLELENTCVQLEEKMVNMEMDDNSKVIELSNLLLGMREQMKILVVRLKESEEQNAKRGEINDKLIQRSREQQRQIMENYKQIGNLKQNINSYEVRCLSYDARIIDLQTQLKKKQREAEQQRENYQDSKITINKLQLLLGEQIRKREELNKIMLWCISQAQQITKIIRHQLQTARYSTPKAANLLAIEVTPPEDLNISMERLKIGIRQLQAYKVQLQQHLQIKIKAFQQMNQQYNQTKATFQQQLNNINQLYQQLNLDFKRKEQVINLKQTQIQSLKTFIDDITTKISEVTSENKLLKDYKLKCQGYEERIRQDERKAERLIEQLKMVNHTCQEKEAITRQKEGLIKAKATAVQHLNTIAKDQLQKICYLEEENRLLAEDLKELQKSNNKLGELVEQKDQMIVRRSQEIQHFKLALSLKESEHQAENQILKLARTKSQQKLNLAQDKYLQDIYKLQQKVAMLQLSQKKFLAAEQTLRNLEHQIRSIEKLWIEMAHYPPSTGIKKFINLINTSHRAPFSREVDKILEYFAKIESCRQQLVKHHKNVSIIFTLLENNRSIPQEGSPGNKIK